MYHLFYTKKNTILTQKGGCLQKFTKRFALTSVNTAPNKNGRLFETTDFMCFLIIYLYQCINT